MTVFLYFFVYTHISLYKYTYICTTVPGWSSTLKKKIICKMDRRLHSPTQSLESYLDR